MAAGSMMPSLSFAAGSKVPLGIQLWTVKSEAQKDLEGTMKQLFALGFREIEFAGYYGRSAADLGKLMKGIGFTLVSTHAGADDIAAKGDQIIADAKTLGLKYIICSSPMSDAAKAKLEWAKKMDALDEGDWKLNADLFNKFGKSVKAAGMQFGYHNHHVEFKKFGEHSGFDTLFASTDAELVKIVDMPDVRKNLTEQGADMQGGTPDDFGAFMRNESARWSVVVKQAGIKQE